MKRAILKCVFISLLTICSITAFALPGVFPLSNILTDSSCGIVNSYKDPQFCSEFKTVTLCYCDAKFPAKLQPLFCPSVSKIYAQAMALYRTLPRLCQLAVNNHQSANLAECEDQWSCVMTGKTYTSGHCPANPDGDLPCPNIN